jgi:hypothetical protein
VTDLVLSHLAVLGAAGGEDEPATLGGVVAPLWPAIVTQHAATHTPSRPGGPA